MTEDGFMALWLYMILAFYAIFYFKGKTCKFLRTVDLLTTRRKM